MKRTLTTLLIASMFIIGCTNNQSFPINSKSPLIVQYFESYDNKLSLYLAFNDKGNNRIYFIDSCNKYSVGDTITFKK